MNGHLPGRALLAVDSFLLALILLSPMVSFRNFTLISGVIILGVILSVAKNLLFLALFPIPFFSPLHQHESPKRGGRGNYPESSPKTEPGYAEAN